MTATHGTGGTGALTGAGGRTGPDRAAHRRIRRR